MKRSRHCARHSNRAAVAVVGIMAAGVPFGAELECVDDPVIDRAGSVWPRRAPVRKTTLVAFSVLGSQECPTGELLTPPGRAAGSESCAGAIGLVRCSTAA